MTSFDLLRSVRDVFVLANKPGQPSDYWALTLAGLHQDNLREAVDALRKNRKEKEAKPKTSALLNTLAHALGAKNYNNAWTDKDGMQQRIVDFLSAHSMTQPTNLIQWKSSPRFAGCLKPRQVADCLFNSGRPLPKRIFTGVGSTLFAPSGYGRLDIHWLAAREGITTASDQDYYQYCIQRADKPLLRATSFKEGANAPVHIDLTGRTLILNSLAEFIGCMYTLLGSNLLDPCNSEPVFRSYNMTDDDRELELKLFRLFREEIERSEEGWVDVLPMPGNNNLIFLRGQHGQFDWVVRDQRDQTYSINPLFPIFKTDELPSAFLKSELNLNPAVTPPPAAHQAA